MKLIFPIVAIALFFGSCNSPVKSNMDAAEKAALKEQRFFPVTAYFKGEINNIKKSGVNPLKYTTVGGRTDSVWLKIEEIDTAVAEFLSPEIDSLNLISLFSEKGFLDQSINAFTLTYDPVVPLPDSLSLRHWDVYIEPDVNTVKRVYMVKQTGNKTLQLTWVNNQWCKIVHIITDAKGNSSVEKEIKLFWDF